jgi:hypothetical protein
LHHNWEEWLPYLAHFDVSEAEKRALIDAVWNIIVGFVDLGWDVRSPALISPEIGGQILDLSAILRAAVVYSETSEKEEA